MPGEFTISCTKLTAIDGEKRATIDKALRLVRQAGERGSKLVVRYGTEPKSGIGFVGRSMAVDPWAP